MRRITYESNRTLQNRQHLARCGCGFQRIRVRKVLVCCRIDGPGAFSIRSCPIHLCPGCRGACCVLFLMCPVRGISDLAFGCAGSNKSSSNWRIGMVLVRVSTCRGLCKFQCPLWPCPYSRGCPCNLHWLGSLAVKRFACDFCSSQIEVWSTIRKPGRSLQRSRAEIQIKTPPRFPAFDRLHL